MNVLIMKNKNKKFDKYIKGWDVHEILIEEIKKLVKSSQTY